MKDKMFVIPGGFVPYNDTVTLLAYKRLRNLDLDMDVFAFKGKVDEGIKKELENDPYFNKFNIKYFCEYEDAIAIKHPLRLFKSLFLMYRYIKESVKEFEKKKYKYIFTSSVPGISHLCGYEIKKKHPEVIWYASFSDPIKGSPYKKDPDLKNKSLFYRLAFWVGSSVYYWNKYEEVAVNQADKLIFICEEQRDFTLSQYQNYTELLNKVIIMPLTYIPSWKMYQNLIEYKSNKNKPLVAVHLGRLYGLRKIDNFLIALKELKEEDSKLSEKIVFHQYSEISKKDVLKIKEYEITDVFVTHDTVDYQTSMNIMKEADVLVLFDTLLPFEKVQPYLPSKIVEYLLLKKPLLGVCADNSPSYRILKEYGYKCVGFTVETIKENIKNIINNQNETIDYSLEKLSSDYYQMIQ